MGSVMTSRDVLASPIDIPDAGQLRVDYIIELAYPAQRRWGLTKSEIVKPRFISHTPS